MATQGAVTCIAPWVAIRPDEDHSNGWKLVYANPNLLFREILQSSYIPTEWEIYTSMDYNIL